MTPQYWIQVLGKPTLRRSAGWDLADAYEAFAGAIRESAHVTPSLLYGKRVYLMDEWFLKMVACF